MVVHLVLTALGAVSGKAQSLVGQDLVGGRVDTSADRDTAIIQVSIV